MTQVLTTAPVGSLASPAPSPAPSARPFRLTMLIPTLVVDGLLPIGLFKGLEAAGMAPIWALAIGCAPPVLNNLRVWLQSRRVDILGILITASIASGVVAPLITGRLGSRIVTDCLLNCGWGLAFLGSLALARPVIFLLIRALVAGDDASRAAAWDGLWRYASFRAAMRGLTMVWGAVYFVQVAIELGLARAAKPDTVVTVAQIMSTGGTLALLVFTRLYMHRVRARVERREGVAWPL
ncbi:MAG TPA: VC0807 family protein [Phenylobacterium sp.]|jgi:hypothetical protein|nr:VC0807 family protein [Phenylobacterium sp.]